VPPRPTDEIIASIHREGRGPTRERALGRQRWFAELAVPDKESALLELETAVEGTVYLPRSLATAERRESLPPEGPDRHRELGWVAEAMRQGSRRVAELLRTPRRRRGTPPPFAPLPLDDPPSRSPRPPRHPEGPDEALRLLSHVLDGTETIARALSAGSAAGARPFTALVGSLAREVGHNPYFCPLHPLELRAELDGLDDLWARQALDRLVSETGRRVAAKAFLGLGRARRILGLGMGTTSADGDDGLPPAVVLSAFRHRIRGVIVYFDEHAGNALADGLEREILMVPAKDLGARAPAIEAGTRALVALRASLEGIAVSLRLETRVPPDTALDPAIFDQLQGAVRGAETRLARTLLGESGASAVEDAAARDRRLRRDAWMFAQVLRGFLAKAEAFSGDADSWALSASQRFVADFLGHFRALGQPLVVGTGYPRRDELRRALATLGETDLLDVPRMERAAAACADFRAHLMGQVDALDQAPFDRQEAAATLRAYLSS